MKTRLVLLFLFCLIKTFSQETINDYKTNINTLPIEKVFLHYNSNILITGEVLTYKVYCFLKDYKKPLSKIVYIEIIDSKLNSIYLDKVNLTDGIAQGDFFISTNLNSGNYKLIAYTKWMQNFNDFFQDDIFIFNPYKNKISHKSDINVKYTQKEDTTIKLTKEKFKKREKVVFELPKQVRNNANLSISVRKKTPFYQPKKSNFNFLDKNNISKTNPKHTKRLIKGKVISKKTLQPLKNKSIGITFLGKKDFFKISKTNDKGIFYLSIKEKNYSSKMFTQVLGSDTKMYKINIFENKKETSLNTLQKSKINTKDITILPDFRGELIQGKVVNKNTLEPAINKQIGISFLGKNGFFKISNTDEKGIFRTILNEKNYPTTVYAEVLDKQSNLYEIKIIKNKKLDFTGLKFNNLKTNNQIQEMINLHSIYNQINNSYKTSNFITKSPSKKSFFKNDFKVFKLSNFTRFKTIEEIMVEIIDGAWINKKNNNYTFFVSNNNYFNDSEPLVLVDGFIVNNHNDLINITTNTIDKISISHKNYVFNSKVYSGIISINTYKGNYKPISKAINLIELITTEPIKKYKFPNYFSENNKRIPDYRTQLYWSPKLQSSEKQIFFYTSDVIGDFEIEIVGFSQNGAPISLRKTFTVTN